MNSPHRTMLILLLCLSAPAVAAPNVAFRLILHGRSPLDPNPASGSSPRLESTAFFEHGRVHGTLLVFGEQLQTDAVAFARRMTYTFVAEDGAAISPSVTVDPPVVPLPRVWSALGARSHADITFSGVPPGRYVIHAALDDSDRSEAHALAPRGIVIYRGDEHEQVRAEWLLARARAALDGSAAGYQLARPLLLEASKIRNDPSILEALADAGAPWVTPQETLSFYKRSVEVARANIASALADSKSQPAKRAERSLTFKERKMRAFESLVPEYANRFAEVRVVVVVNGVRAGQFVMERRADGARVRVVDFEVDFEVRMRR